MNRREGLRTILTTPHAGSVTIYNSRTPNFDVVCQPMARRMEVKVRIAWAFEGDWTSNWTADAQAEFKRKYHVQIQKYWSGRFRLKLHIDPAKLKASARPGTAYWYPILPHFTVVEAPQPHYTIHVKKKKYERSFVQGGACTLFRTTADDMMPALFNKLHHRQGMAGKIANKLLPIPGVDAVTHFKKAEGRIDFNQGSTDYSPAGHQRLTHVANLLYQELPTFELVDLFLTGFSAAGEERGLALPRAEKVRRDLIAAGVPSVQLKSQAGGVIPPSKVYKAPTTGYVEVKLEANPRQRLVAEPHAWPVAAHEFGHMLGLLDEYCPEGDPQIADELPMFMLDCEKFGTTKPRFGVRGTSIMSWGYHVYPAHYVTLANALNQIIVAGTRQRSLGDESDETYETGQALRAALTVSVDPLPMGNHVEENERVNYLDWMRNVYHQDG